MTPYQVKKRAMEDGKSVTGALKARMTFLALEIVKWVEYIEEQHNDVPYGDIDANLDEIKAMYSALKTLYEVPSKNSITPQMIDLAKTFPIGHLVEFVHGKCHCPFHDDKTPSAYYATRTNYLNCPVCNDRWNPIDILVKRDELNFLEAVRTLCSRLQ